MIYCRLSRAASSLPATVCGGWLDKRDGHCVIRKESTRLNEGDGGPHLPTGRSVDHRAAQRRLRVLKARNLSHLAAESPEKMSIPIRQRARVFLPYPLIHVQMMYTSTMATFSAVVVRILLRNRFFICFICLHARVRARTHTHTHAHTEQQK